MFKRYLENGLFLLWGSATLMILSLIGSWHYSDFSQQKKLSNLKVNSSTRWKLHHFIGGDCKCSEFIVDYLIKRKTQFDIDEEIVVFDDVKNFKSRLIKMGFNVSAMAYKDYPKENRPSGFPILLITNPSGEVVYEGGYSEKMINPYTEFNDLKLVQKFKENNRKIASLPAYGCYSSQKYRDELDPLGFKY
jgi:hypothetical protein